MRGLTVILFRHQYAGIDGTNFAENKISHWSSLHQARPLTSILLTRLCVGVGLFG